MNAPRTALSVVLFLILVAVCPIQAAGDVPGSYINADAGSRISPGIGLAPLVGYDPSLGVVVGGAIFKGTSHPPITNSDLILYGTLAGKVALELDSTIWDQGNTVYGIEIVTNNFDEFYWGEGNHTRASDEVTLQRYKAVVSPSVRFRLDRKTSVGVFSELNYRNESYGTEPALGGGQLAALVGGSFTWDGRDHEVDPSRGSYLNLTLGVAPEFLGTRGPGSDFGRLMVDWRHFEPATRWMTLAFQAQAGADFGNPGYMYRFYIGGDKKLRGFMQNRFRGAGYYVLQGESRMRAARWLSFVTFAGVGDVADERPSDFGLPKPTGGVGLRVGVPPDFIAKARLDVGASADGIAVYLNFNEAF